MLILMLLGGNEEDSKLLIGFWEYGLGSWEHLKSDRDLGLGDKIFLNSNVKPQAKDLDVRAASLLRTLHNNSEDNKVGMKIEKVYQVKEIADDSNKENKIKEFIEDDDSSDEGGEKDREKKVEKWKEEKKKENSKAALGLNELLQSDLDPATVAQCKEKIRNVEKSLKALDKPDPNQTPQEQVRIL